MPKETPAVVGTDPIEIIGQQRAVRTTRGEPKLVEMRQRDVVLKVQHAYDRGCDIAFGGAFPRTADTRFRIAHRCSAIPNRVVFQRIDNEVGWQADGSSVNGMRGSDDLVPDTNTYSGYNATRYRNTQTYGAVLINNCTPYADQQYVYCTVAFPITLYSVIGKFAASGASFDVEVPEYCGLVLSATAQVWEAPVQLFSLGVAIGSSFGYINPDQSGGLCGVGTAGSVRQLGYPNEDNRVVRVFAQGAADTWFNARVLVNAFCAPRNASKVRVRVFSEVWENIGAPDIVISPSSEAHPAA